MKACNVFLSEFNKYAKEKYTLVTFHAYDRNNKLIYHTNVMLSVLQDHVVICEDSIKDSDEKITVNKFIAENRTVIKLSYEEMEKFGANILNVASSVEGKKNVLVLSQTAFDNFSKKNKGILEKNYDLCPVDIGTIEKIGGGSARCMVAEIY